MNILVYAGRGVSPECLHHTTRSLRSVLGAFYDIKTVSAECLAAEPWEEGCLLLVLPGGRDLPFVEELQGRAISRIQRYVLEGRGRYFGICAGAYFACARVEFEKGTPLEVVGQRDLALCPATAVGCVYPGFEYGGDGGAHAALVRVADTLQETRIYYNGGCYFDFERGGQTQSRSPFVFETAAVYAEKENRPAIVIGRLPDRVEASVVLTGVHIEYDPAEVEAMKPALPILDELNSNAKGQQTLWRWVLKIFGLNVSETQDAVVQMSPTPTPLFMFFSKDEQRRDFLRALKDNELYSTGKFRSDAQLFSIHEEPPSEGEALKATDEEYSLVLNKSPISSKDPSWTFSPQKYYTHLQEKSGTGVIGSKGIGEHLIYAEYIFSTQTMALQYGYASRRQFFV